MVVVSTAGIRVEGTRCGVVELRAQALKRSTLNPIQNHRATSSPQISQNTCRSTASRRLSRILAAGTASDRAKSPSSKAIPSQPYSKSPSQLLLPQDLTELATASRCLSSPTYKTDDSSNASRHRSYSNRRHKMQKMGRRFVEANA